VTRVEVQDHFYWICESGTFPTTVDLTGSGTGLINVQDGTAAVITGTGMGPVDVRTESLHNRPEELASGWDEVAEASLASSGQPLVIVNFDGFICATLPVDGPGSYRLRVHARGRDAANEHVTSLVEPLEEHLLQLWPAPEQETQLLETRDQFGAVFGRVSGPAQIGPSG
jgi:hypothetical protein